jgi:glycine/D-amino acid oxidase-like deaminating enzyme
MSSWTICLVRMRIVVIGCGVVGAAIAYELSRIASFKVTVLDQQPPAQAATGAALGVLMGIISQKTKGRAWKLRQTSIRRYQTLIPELEAAGQRLPWNPQGVLKLGFGEEDWQQWDRLIDDRQSQGWQLERWDLATLRDRCPQVRHPDLTGAIYSPQDLQIDPTALTLALVAVAQQNGVEFRFDAAVESFTEQGVKTGAIDIPADWIVIAAGLGSKILTQNVADVRPVLGQALRLKLEQPLAAFQPAITGNDIHVVPLPDSEYWVGATVEFADEVGAVTAEAARLEEVLRGAIAFCPALASGTILHTWTGLRPRPHQCPAPIIELLAGYRNVFLATGHYRNGVLLAPATALAVRDAACAFFGVSL